MTRDDDHPSVPLPAGAARRQVQQMTQLYRGPVSTVECPDCLGKGQQTRPSVFPNGRPQQFVCMGCRGQGRVRP